MKGALHPAVGIGHVHLRVAELDRAVAFHRDLLGFAVTAYGPDLGLPGAAFLAAGDYHHHIGLNTWGGVVRHSRAGQRGAVAKRLISSPRERTPSLR
jgi:catechol-2,3-dioxygenase